MKYAITLFSDECKRASAWWFKQIGWFAIKFRNWESQFHYFVILTVLYPCRLKSSIDMLPEVRSSHTLRRPTERLKAAFFSSFVSYTFIIVHWFSRCKSTNFLRLFQIKHQKLVKDRAFLFIFVSFFLFVLYSIGRIILSIKAISGSPTDRETRWWRSRCRKCRALAKISQCLTDDRWQFSETWGK